MNNDSRIRFENDYSECAHPAVLERLGGMTQRAGYGMDDACAAAAGLIRGMIDFPDADVHFMIGGTSANLTAIAAFLRPHEAVICVDTSHINTHETGAPEASGHKLIALQTADGKIRPEQIERAFAGFPDEHMVKPRLVFIANATELGTCYDLAELKALRAVCDRLGLLLYMDGARLGSALAASDVAWRDLPHLFDAFYIGGTKNGALFGEAMVIVNSSLKPDFRYIIKQRGGMLAKGFLLGLQFLALFEDDLYMRLARHANGMAEKLRAALRAKGVPFYPETPTNQLFAEMPELMIDALSARFAFHTITPVDRKVARLVTSWATTEEQAEMFAKAIEL